MITKGNPGQGRVMGLYDITILNATGGNQLSLNKEQKMRAEIEYLLENMSTVSWLYIVLIGIRNEIYKIIRTHRRESLPFAGK